MDVLFFFYDVMYRGQEWSALVRLLSLTIYVLLQKAIVISQEFLKYSSGGSLLLKLILSYFR
jgi:hypothetical protein